MTESEWTALRVEWLRLEATTKENTSDLFALGVRRLRFESWFCNHSAQLREHIDALTTTLRAAEERGAARERQQCAILAMNWEPAILTPDTDIAAGIAAAIRARAN
jgi:hypothetical protein